MHTRAHAFALRLAAMMLLFHPGRTPVPTRPPSLPRHGDRIIAACSTTDGGGAGSADGGGGAVANYNHPDLNAVFALMRKDTAKLEFEMQKSQADYNAQKHGVLMEDPGSSASDLNKAAFAMVKAFQDRLQRNKVRL